MSSTLGPWADVLADPSIAFFEHPTLPMLVSKKDMDDELGSMLAQLDGGALGDVVDTFYTRDATDGSVLRFRDEPAKLDILDWAIEVGCLPPLGQSSTSVESTSFQPGELLAELARVRQRALVKAPKQQIRKKGAPILAQITGRRKALEKLRANLEQTVHDAVRAFLQVKIAQAEKDLSDLIAKSMQSRV
jgi:hypothetical protein